MGGACAGISRDQQHAKYALDLPQGEMRGKCRLWTGVNHPEFIYPELSNEYCEVLEKKNIGIALSGGGVRALSHAIGTLRGLHLLGLFSKIRYISSNSGSSWLNGPLCYSKNDISSLLGEYFPPEQCGLENLRNTDPATHASKISNRETSLKMLRKLKDHFIDQNNADPRSFWSELIGEFYFKPYHLDNFDHLPVLAGGNQKDIVDRTGFPIEKFNSCDLRRSPFPIINGCVVVRGDQFTAPVEFTPLYYGLPGKSTFEGVGKQYPVGGYLIEPFGFTSKPSDVEANSMLKMVHSVASPAVVILDLPHPRKIIGVSDQAAISSAAFTHVLGRAISPSQVQFLDLNVYPIWNPLGGETHQMLFSDGLGTDNMGIHALLRRKVTKIISMYSGTVPLSSIIEDPSQAEIDLGCVAGLFGAMRNASSLEVQSQEEYNRLHQVFPREDFERLMCGLLTNYHQGKPCIYLLQTRALANHHVGVPGGHHVELLFLTSDAPAPWLNALPQEVRQKLPKVTQKSDTPLIDDNEECIVDSIEDIFNNLNEKTKEVKEIMRVLFHRSNLKDFPSPLTTSLDFSVELVSLLTNLMTWQVLESKSFFDELFQG